MTCVKEINSNYSEYYLKEIPNNSPQEIVKKPYPVSSSRAGQRRLRRETVFLHKDLMEAPPAYVDLPCTEKDKELIAELTRDLAKHDSLWFLIHAQELKKKMKALGKRVHVLKMLEILFADTALKKYITAIAHDPTKWDMVLRDIKKKMQRAEKKGQLHCYMNDFAIAVGVPLDEIHPFFLRKDWEGLLTYLIK